MQKYFSKIFIVAGNLFLFLISQAQPGFNKSGKIDRQPAVASSFYPGDKAGLIKSVEILFNNLPDNFFPQPLAIIVPHAGYVFSGSVAAAGFKQIERNSEFKHVFIIGSSHTTNFTGASVYSDGDFITPLGKVEVDPLAAEMVKKHDFISNNVRVHEREHSIEVQLPFLQYWLKKPFRIVPIIIGGESAKTCSQLASVLEPYFNSDNLFVISTDFSHYPNYQDAVTSDNLMAESVLSNSSKTFLKAKYNAESKGISNLATAMCGWTSVLTLLSITEKNHEVSYRKIAYQNSGDSQYGGKDRVVGYCSIGVIMKR